MIARRFIKNLAAQSLATILRPDRRIANSSQRFIFCYHRVIPSTLAKREWVHDAMWVSPESFDEQIEWLKSMGEVVDLTRLLDFGAKNSRPLFALTFDDGWQDNLSFAFPIIKRHSVPATIFVATSCMDRGTLMWPEDLTKKTASLETSELDIESAIFQLAPGKLPAGTLRTRLEVAIEQLKHLKAEERGLRLRRYYERLKITDAPLEGDMLNWKEARELHAFGVRIESHSHTHKIFTEATDQEIRLELEVSRDRIRTELGHDVMQFAYPNARYQGTEGAILSQIGYKHALRIHDLPVRSDSDPYFVPRFLVSELRWRSPDLFKLRMLGLLQSPTEMKVR